MAMHRAMASIISILVCTLAFTQSAPAEDIQAMLADAQSLWPQRGDLNKTRQMIKIYQEILNRDQNNIEALWKQSRAHYWLGGHSPKEEKLAIFEKGIEHAKTAIALKDDCVDCHYWLGVCYGVYGREKGVLKSLSLVDPIKEEMNRVIELDPNYGQGGAYRILGRLAFKLPWFAGGSKKESVKHFQKALEVGPNSILTRVFLAETYLAMKKEDLAKVELEWVLNAPDSVDPGDKDDKERARELYEEHFR